MDGKISSSDHDTGLWLGFHGDDLDATIDLGESRLIRRIELRCLQSNDLGIYIPSRLEVDVSDDGKTFTPISSIELKPVKAIKGNRIHTFSAGDRLGRHRFVRIRANNVAKIPSGNRAAGQKAWLFVDEIVINPIQGKTESLQDR